jgi:hypothetical protein
VVGVVVGAIVAVVEVGGTVVTDALVPELLHADASAIASAMEAAMVLRRDIERFVSHRRRTARDVRVATPTVTCIRDCCRRGAVGRLDDAVERRDTCRASGGTVPVVDATRRRQRCWRSRDVRRGVRADRNAVVS